MSLALRISLIAGVLIYTAVILVFLRKKTLNLKYTLLWLFSAVVLFLMALFPKALEVVTNLLGIEYVVNAVFLMAIFLILLILISLTAIVSKQHKQIKELIQTIALLKKEIEDNQNSFGGK